MGEIRFLNFPLDGNWDTATAPLNGEKPLQRQEAFKFIVVELADGGHLLVHWNIHGGGGLFGSAAKHSTVWRSAQRQFRGAQMFAAGQFEVTDSTRICVTDWYSESIGWKTQEDRRPHVLAWLNQLVEQKIG